MSILLVGAVTESVQVDGHWHGTPAISIKLMAPVGEPSYTPNLDSLPYVDPRDYPIPSVATGEISLSQMLRGRCNPDEYSRVGEATLWRLLTSRRGRHIVIYGPEPCHYQLERLTELLHGSGRKIQVETRGRAVTDLADHIWITLRPSPVRDGELDVLPEALSRANEVIAKIYRATDLDRLDKLMLGCSTPVWLVPSERHVGGMCVEAASFRGWRVSGPMRSAVLA